MCSRSVGSFGPPKEEQEVQHFFLFLFLDLLFFSGFTEYIRFPQPNHAGNNASYYIPFVPMLSEGG